MKHPRHNAGGMEALWWTVGSVSPTVEDGGIDGDRLSQTNQTTAENIGLAIMEALRVIKNEGWMEKS